MNADRVRRASTDSGIRLLLYERESTNISYEIQPSRTI